MVIKIKNVNLGTILFYTAFTLLWIFTFFNTTTFGGVFRSSTVRLVITVIAILLIACKCIFCDKYGRNQLLLFLILIALGIIVYAYSDRIAILNFIILVVGCKGIDLKRFVRWFLFIGVVCLLITMACSMTGVIVNYATYRSGSALPRYAFGLNYTTDFAAFVFFLLLAYHYVREHKIKFWDIVVHIAIVLFLNRFCDARLSEIMIIFTLVMFLIYDYRKNIFQRKFFKWVTTLVTVIAGLFSIGITYAYSSSSVFWVAVDNVVFAKRLSIGKRVMDTYGFSPFGQYFWMQGQGYYSSLQDNPEGITFLDSSYVQILLVYGIILFAVLMICYIVSSKRVWENGDLKLAIIIVILAVDCIWNQYLINMVFNPFIVIIGIYLLHYRRQNKGVSQVKNSVG